MYFSSFNALESRKYFSLIVRELSPRTFRKWSSPFIDALSSLEVVELKTRRMVGETFPIQNL
jgi:hypothetical protein